MINFSPIASRDKLKTPEEINSYIEDVIEKISSLDERISDLPDLFESFTTEQKNQLFQQFERVSQNFVTLSSWFSLPACHRDHLRVSPTFEAFISQDERSVVIKFLEFAKK